MTTAELQFQQCPIWLETELNMYNTQTKDWFEIREHERFKHLYNLTPPLLSHISDFIYVCVCVRVLYLTAETSTADTSEQNPAT